MTAEELIPEKFIDENLIWTGDSVFRKRDVIDRWVKYIDNDISLSEGVLSVLSRLGLYDLQGRTITGVGRMYASLNRKNYDYFVKWNPTGKFVEKVYRFNRQRFNDGSIRICIQYHSESGCWMGTSLERHELLPKLEYVTEEEAKQLMSGKWDI